MKLYAYSMVWDTGFAPAQSDGVLSLACCKSLLRPAIANELSKNPHEEIYLIGLCGIQMAKRHNFERQYFPVFIAQITDTVSTEDYYQLSEYSKRPDRQYKYNSKTGVWTVLANNPHHPDKCLDNPYEERDLYYLPNRRHGIQVQPPFNDVLLSSKYLYFGNLYSNIDMDVTIAEIMSRIGTFRRNNPRSDRSEIQLSKDEQSLFRDWFMKQTPVKENNIDDYFMTGKCKGERNQR